VSLIQKERDKRI